MWMTFSSQVQVRSSEHHEAFWAELSKKVDLEDIGDLSRFLGRHHEAVILPDGGCGLAFDMKDYVRAACERYAALPGVKPFRKEGCNPLLS